MSYENIEKNQEFKSFGVITTFVMILACGLFILPAWRGSPGQNEDQAMRRAESLAYQLIEIKMSVQKDNRGPASAADEGEIGTDPWGQPYKYRLLNHQAKDGADKNSYALVVWSSGPNKKAETKIQSLDPDREKFDENFGGDDLGIRVLAK